VIVVDTSILLYSVGEDHPLRDPCRRLVDAVRRGKVPATATAEVIQEFVHVRGRRRPRSDAVALGRDFVRLLRPLVGLEDADLDRGFRLFERTLALGAFDAVLAAVALRLRAQALVSADKGFGSVPGLKYVDPASHELERLLPTGPG